MFYCRKSIRLTKLIYISTKYYGFRMILFRSFAAFVGLSQNLCLVVYIEEHNQNAKCAKRWKQSSAI